MSADGKRLGHAIARVPLLRSLLLPFAKWAARRDPELARRVRAEVLAAFPDDEFHAEWERRQLARLRAEAKRRP